VINTVFVEDQNDPTVFRLAENPLPLLLDAVSSE
jgi:hypothetical protein